jgi:DNA-binding MarR family transcriptional regulator
VIDSNSRIEEGSIVYHVLGYLADNPEAEDTLEGIVEWWLLQQRIKYEMARVKEALQELLAKGFITEVRGPEKSPFYRINQQKREEIERLLNQHTERRSAEPTRKD